MIYTLPTPVGIDISIQAMQNLLFAQLKNTWNITADQWDCYGRVERNIDKESNDYIPEYLYPTANGYEYKEVLLNDKMAVTSFFGAVLNTKYSNGSALADVSAIFMINLGIIRGGTLAENAREDLIKLFKAKPMGFTLVGWQEGIENVFREYPGTRRDNLKLRDMYPWKSLRFNTQVLYSPLNC